MKKIIIATHGKLAEGYKNSIELICGQKENLIALCFYTESEDPNVDELLNSMSDIDQFIFCTDIHYGSVNKVIISSAIKFKNKNIQIISGINLPIVLELITREGKLNNTELDGIVESASQQIIRFSLDEMIEQANNSEDFF